MHATVAVSPEAAEEMVRRGLILVDEARSRLDREIISSFAVPPATIEQTGKPPGVPVITDYCPCGKRFAGTPVWVMHEREACLRTCRAAEHSTPARWEWHCRCGAGAQGNASTAETAAASGRDGLADHRRSAQCAKFAEWNWRWR